MKNLLLLCSLMSTGSILFAQAKTTEKVNQMWYAFLNQTRISKHWGTWTDLHLRQKEDFFSNFSTSIVRVGLTYYATDATRLTVGYAWVNHFPSKANNSSQLEHRPWQQVQWFNNYRKKQMMQYVRLEERFRKRIIDPNNFADDYNFNFRLRYNFWYDMPLSSKGLANNTVSFFFNDEVHVNFGKEIVNNYFDQNRLYMGFKYQFDKATNLQLGYLNIFTQLPAGNQYRSMNGARLTFFKNFDLRKKNTVNQ